MSLHQSQDNSTNEVFPQELREWNQWVIWRYVLKYGEDKPRKLLFQARRSSSVAKVDTPSTWGPYETARLVADKHPLMEGPGFVFTEEDPYTGIDFDKCRSKQTGEVDPWVLEWLDRLPGYKEVSPSEAGIKVTVKGKLSGRGKKAVIDGHEVEMYDQGRFFTMTGNVFGEVSNPEDAQEAVDELYGLILQARGEDKKSRAQGGCSSSTTSVDVDGPPIPDGTRYLTLLSICGRLHDGTRSENELFTDLMAINQARCIPEPVGKEEVYSIVHGVHQKEPCRPTAPKVTEEVLSLVCYLQELADRRPIKGKAGASGWAIYNAMLELARKYGRRHERGVEFRADYRTISQMAGVGSTTTVGNFVQKTKLVEVLQKGTGKQATRLLLVVPDGVPDGGPEIGVPSVHSTYHGVSNGGSEQFRPLFRMLYRLRWSTPSRGLKRKPLRKDSEEEREVRKSHLVRGSRKVRQSATVQHEGTERIGKSRAAILAATPLIGDCATRKDLAKRLGRTPDSLKKPLKWLVDAGLMDRVSRGHYRVSDELQRLVEDFRALGGEPETEREQIREHKRQREAYRRRHETKTDHAPSYDEMPFHQPRPESELERMPDPREDVIQALTAWLERSPKDREQGARWLADTLWAYDLVEPRATREDVEVALFEMERKDKRGAA